MPIAVKLEFVFDSPDDVIDLFGQFVPMSQSHLPPAPTTHQERIERTEAQAQPLMDMLAQALAQKGMQPVRLQDVQAPDKDLG